MKGPSDAILHAAQASYLERTLPPREALLAEMESAAREDSIPISDPEVGRLLELLACSRQARRILEVGTAIGYGSLWLARGAPQGEIVTIERDPAMIERARGYLERAGVGERVEIRHGEALDVLPGLSGPFDLVYLDAAKSEYRRTLDLALPRIAVGGLIVVDNLLWKGMVADPEGRGDDATAEELRAFNGYFLSHPQLASIVLPLGDGVGLAAKTRPLVQEMGGPF